MRENAVASQDELSDDGLVDAIGKDQRRELGREGTELVRLFPWSGHPDNGSRWSRRDGQASGTWVRGAVVPADILARLAPHVTRRTSEAVVFPSLTAVFSLFRGRGGVGVGVMGCRFVALVEVEDAVGC
ncbi:hypothetical protein, partial [Streptomyces sp. Wh19]|uniref:hypothetical protein n=1 Tax=Streptomyces sp. Wh19 TaxID=3076629 RepID=UPI002958C967